ncbi:MAG: YihY family inner membrane protein [Deltaproteobacteria bacterium]|nr:YihY family inner membrane protein [Deltaproteobacteria bacterium]MBW2305883.1 YihY family inner membrane protein [Deltaproteobacteria bacterium]
MINERLFQQAVKRWTHFFQRELWEEDIDRRGWKHLWVAPLRIILLVWDRRRSHLLFLRASALTYVTAMSIVPTLAFVFALAKGFGVHQTLEPFLLKYVSAGQEEVVRRVIQYIGNTNVKALGSIGFALVLFSVIQAMGTIERSFNDIWGIRSHRRGFRKVADYISILAICPLAVTFSLAMTATISSATITQKLRLIGPISQVMDWLFALGPYTMLWLGFIFLYMFAPNTRVRPGSAIIGGILAGTLWQVSLWSYTYFQVGLARYNAIYSGFASLPFFLVWLYVSWVIVLFGAVITFFHQNLHSFRSLQSTPHASPLYRERLALRAMMGIAHRFYSGGPPWDMEEISRALQVHPSLLEEVLSKLHDGGLLMELQSGGRRFIPARALGKISMLDVVMAISSGGYDPPEPMTKAEKDMLRDTLAPARMTFEKTLGDINFQQLCQNVGGQYLSPGPSQE